MDYLSQTCFRFHIKYVQIKDVSVLLRVTEHSVIIYHWSDCFIIKFSTLELAPEL